MNRPTRKRTHLLEKVSLKSTRSTDKKPGKRAKRWQKWIKTYEPVVAPAQA